MKAKIQTYAPALRHYLFGQALILVGAAVMEWTHSMVPMALAGSAALMLTVPLIRQIASRGRKQP